MIETHTYARRPFHVDAVQVTAENMFDVASWCEGDIQNTGSGSDFIRVQVHRPLTERQTKAFAGDWVLYAGSGFKVYTTKAFENSFELVSSTTVMHGGASTETPEPAAVADEPVAPQLAEKE